MGRAPGPSLNSHPIAAQRRAGRSAVGLVLLLASAACAERAEVVPPPRLQLDPSEVRLEVGEEATLQAALFNESGRSLGAVSAEWSSRDPSVAQVSAEGIVRGHAVGETVVVASSAEARGTASVVVEPAKVAAVQIAPEDLRIFPGETAALAATPLSARGQPIEGLEPPIWTSDDPEIVSVSTSGILTARSPGAATVSARIEGVTGSVSVVVIPHVSVIRVEPSELSLVEGTRATLQAVLIGSNGEVIEDRAVEWSAFDASVATIDAEGEVTALVPGKTALYAEAEGVVGLATATVLARLTSLRVEPQSAVLQIGTNLGLRAIVTNSLGSERSGVGCRWRAAPADRLWVGPTGGVGALAEGEGTISVECEGLEAAGTVQVVPREALQLVGPDRVAVDEEVQLEVRKSGAVVSGTVAWDSGDPLLVTLDGDGKAAGVRPGKPHVFAMAEGRAVSRELLTVMRFDRLYAAPNFTCGRTAAGRTFHCWGGAPIGRWGEVFVEPTPIPFPFVEPRMPSGGIRPEKLFVGGWGRAVAMESDGGTFGYVMDPWDLTGDPLGIDSLGLGLVELAFGYSGEVCGLDAQGRAWCNGNWGWLATDLSFKQIVINREQACGLTSAGEVQCWRARNEPGNVAPAVPMPLEGGLRFRAVTSGLNHFCGIDIEGVAWCWGTSDEGALGAGGVSTSATPLQVSGGLEFNDIFASVEHTCGVTSEGEVYCWGLGQTTPVAVGLAGTYTQVVAGARHACALRSDRTTVCWGDNSLYQVGDEREKTEGLSPRPIYPENLER
ncbi:MAG TPA: Ig-like domain-containing protein [Vulgatibacter sp.]|nr:Ig-like domain-containing protein [Vulgatibacter sp.]